VGQQRTHELQQLLMRDDAYVPGLRRELSDTNASARLAASQGDPEPLRDGITRPVGDEGHYWLARPGDWVAYDFERPTRVEEATLVLDSALDRLMPGVSHYPLREGQLLNVPPTMPKALGIEGLVNGDWRGLWRADNNYQRLVRVPIGCEVDGLRLTIESTWGAPKTRVFAVYVD
jgi:hypothetical protein